jgi:pimeloyl-ACP methyl ester carboxylesterase
MLEAITRPIGSVLRAASRPETYPGHVRELTSTLLTASVWPAGWREGDEPDRAPTGGDDPESSVGTPVLLVHGFGANKSNWLFVERYLRQAGFGRVDALNYNPLTHDVPALAGQVVDRARSLQERYGVERIHLIGHSLGGVLVRYAVQVHDLENVGVAATISSPHGGIRLARHASWMGLRHPASGIDLAPHSPVMRSFRETARPLPTRFVAYYSNLDLIVPARRAIIREPELGATNILVKDHGHVSIMLSRRLATSIVTQLGAADGLAGYGAPVTRLRGPNDAPATAERDLPQAVSE